MRIPIDAVYLLRGIGVVACGRIESGSIHPNMQVDICGSENMQQKTGSVVASFREWPNIAENVDPIPAG